MITNQKFRSLRFINLICLLLFTLSSFGQFKVEDIRRGEKKIPKVEIELIIGDEIYPRTITRKTKDLNDKATIRVIGEGIILELTTSNGNTLVIPGSNIVKIDITKTKEDYQLISGNKDNVIIDVIKEFTGSVVATGIKKRFTAATDGTKFTLSLDGDDLDIVLNNGSLNVSYLKKKEISDSSVIGNNNKRAIFISENKRLTVKDSTYRKNDVSNQSLLTSDKEIKKFLSKQFKKQKRALMNLGPLSKLAIKDLESEGSTDKTLLSFEEAIESGELEIDLLIQSALLFADSYLYNDNLEKSGIWIEVGLYFGKILYDTKQEKLNARLNDNIDKSDYKEINNAITNAFRYEMLTANEFRAWGYDIKLKLNGCLENPSENPMKYRSNAKELFDRIEQNN